MKNRLGTFSFDILPVISEIIFIPLCFLTTEIFLCEQAVDLNFDRLLEFKESFLQSTCKIFCGDKMHLVSLMIFTFALIFYIPLHI